MWGLTCIWTLKAYPCISWGSTQAGHTQSLLFAMDGEESSYLYAIQKLLSIFVYLQILKLRLTNEIFFIKIINQNKIELINNSFIVSGYIINQSVTFFRFQLKLILILSWERLILSTICLPQDISEFTSTILLHVMYILTYAITNCKFLSHE